MAVPQPRAEAASVQRGYIAVGRMRCLAMRVLKVEKWEASWSYMCFIRDRRWGCEETMGGVWAV
jgi:hypothetical protein